MYITPMSHLWISNRVWLGWDLFWMLHQGRWWRRSVVTVTSPTARAAPAKTSVHKRKYYDYEQCECCCCGDGRGWQRGTECRHIALLRWQEARLQTLRYRIEGLSQTGRATVFTRGWRRPSDFPARALEYTSTRPLIAAGQDNNVRRENSTKARTHDQLTSYHSTDGAKGS